MDRISLYMAGRETSAYFKVHGRIPFKLVHTCQADVDETREVPVVFLGDSAGGTDYKKGLSGMRGQVACVTFVGYMLECLQKSHSWYQAFDQASGRYQAYWNGVLEREFVDRDSLYESHKATNNIYYHYNMDGRTFKKTTGSTLDLIGQQGFEKVLHILVRDDPEEYQEMKRILTQTFQSDLETLGTDLLGTLDTDFAL